VFDEEIVPRLLTINGMLEEIRQTSQKNIFSTSRTIQQIKQDITHLMLWGLAGALFISLCASYYFSRSVLKPIQSLTRATREIGEGNLDQMVPILSHDELGELANAFNKWPLSSMLTAKHDGKNRAVARHYGIGAGLVPRPDLHFGPTGAD